MTVHCLVAISTEDGTIRPIPARGALESSRRSEQSDRPSGSITKGRNLPCNS
jgi:hypothetical protein